MHRRDHIDIPSRFGRTDDEHAEQAAEPVDVPLAGHYGFLGDAGDSILCVGQVDAVPVQGDPIGDRVVDQRHLDQLALLGLDQRTRGFVVEGVALDGLTGRQDDVLLAGNQGDRDVRLTRPRAGQLGDRYGTWPHNWAGQRVGCMPRVAGPAAVVGVSHVHHRVGLGDQAPYPQPAERDQDRERCDDTHDDPVRPSAGQPLADPVNHGELAVVWSSKAAISP